MLYYCETFFKNKNLPWCSVLKFKGACLQFSIAPEKYVFPDSLASLIGCKKGCYLNVAKAASLFLCLFVVFNCHALNGKLSVGHVFWRLSLDLKNLSCFNVSGTAFFLPIASNVTKFALLGDTFYYFSGIHNPFLDVSHEFQEVNISFFVRFHKPFNLGSYSDWNRWVVVFFQGILEFSKDFLLQETVLELVHRTNGESLNFLFFPGFLVHTLNCWVF